MSEILDVLEKKYGSMVDGEELLIDFYNIYQNKMSAGDYLSHLYVELGDVVRYGGLPISKFDKVMLKQFIRGTTDDDMLLKLRLEDKLHNPPSFPNLIQMIRREEAERTARKLRLRKQVKVQSVMVEKPQQDAEMQRMQERVAELEKIAAGVTELAPELFESSPELAQISQRVASMEQRMKQQVRTDIFCYRCGIDKHMATECTNSPNKQLVREKMETRRKGYVPKN